MDTIGICPECKEWTEVQDSCCGHGAIVEGDLIKSLEGDEK